MEELKLLHRYSPYIYFNEKEPFFPRVIGYTFIHESQKSPSAPRDILINHETTAFAIEYAIYWDFDIGHLYELEHYWVYVGHNGEVVNAEASFHGSYFTCLLKDHSNLLDETHVKIYSQPGKHGFCALKEIYQLIPGIETTTYERAGDSGICVTEVAKGRYENTDETREIVREYLQKRRFHPSDTYLPYSLEKIPYIPWEELDAKIPLMVSEKLEEMRRELGR